MEKIKSLMNALSIGEIEKKIGYSFKDKSYIYSALVHSSFLHENPTLCKSDNERLEFLGDSVLGAIVSDFLFHNIPSEEGDLSFFRAHFVEGKSCLRYAIRLGIDSFLLVGKGEQTPGRGRETMVADLFEALIAAIFLDGGYSVAKDFFLRHFEEELKEILKNPPKNWKARLQDYAQKRYQIAPKYELVAESGALHQKIFEVQVEVNGRTVGRGQGPSKKSAEMAAAEAACRHMDI